MTTPLVDLQRAFADRLARTSDDVGDGLSVYRRTIRSNYRHALQATYPVVRALTGDAAFDLLVDDYVARFPSTSGDLNVYGASFAEVLRDAPSARRTPCLPDVARLEWLVDEASRAADALFAPAEVFAALQRIPPPALLEATFALQPDRRLFRSAHPVMLIWQRHRVDGASGNGSAAEPTVVPAAGPAVGDDLLLVSRRDDGVQVERLTAAEHAWLAALGAGAVLGDALQRALAIETAFDVAGAVGARIGDGTLAAPRLPDSSAACARPTQ